MEGYAKLAQLMGTHEDFAILRRFKSLNYQNLLYLQARIIHLEQELSKIVDLNAAHPERKFYARDWWSLAHATGKDARRQWKKTLKLRKNLALYNDALSKQVYLARLDGPNKHDLEFLRSWFERPSMGSFPLRGLDRDAWHPADEDDLVAVRPRKQDDALSRFVANIVMPMYHNSIGHRVKKPSSPELGDDIFTYREARIVAMVDIMTTIVAAISPILSIVVLYLFKSNTVKLGMVVAFSALFAFILAMMTSARKIEVFAATSAFAAVNVVFLTNQVPPIT